MRAATLPPQSAIRDRPSVKTRLGGGRGCDGGPHRTGHHILVATQGTLCAIVVPAATMPQRQGRLGATRLAQGVRAGIVAGPITATPARSFPGPRAHGRPPEAVASASGRGDEPGLRVSPTQGSVARPCAGIGRPRRRSTDDERLTGRAVAFPSLAGVRPLPPRRGRSET